MPFNAKSWKKRKTFFSRENKKDKSRGGAASLQLFFFFCSFL
jgi:hypothetical protein